jgi:ATP-dependent Clp protease adaptor protein ClpS
MSKSVPKTEEELEVKERQKTKRPPSYRVFLLNDDYTTMEFVVYILEEVFHKPTPEATQIMLYVHKKGIGLAGVYIKEIAETKISAVHDLARENEFPLRCVMEKE